MALNVRPNKDSAKHRPHEYFVKDNIIGGEIYIKARCNHIFINVSDFDKKDIQNTLAYMRQGHKVHIFITSIHDNMLGRNSLIEFCKLAFKIVKTEINIHTPKMGSLDTIKQLPTTIDIKMHFYGFDKYRLIHSNTNLFKFIETFGNRPENADYISIGWECDADSEHFDEFYIKLCKPYEDKDGRLNMKERK